MNLKHKWTKHDVDEKTHQRRLKCLNSWISLILQTVFPAATPEVYDSILQNLFSCDEKVNTLAAEILDGYRQQRSHSTCTFFLKF